MATQRWTSAEMAGMSGPLTEAGHADRQVLESVPEVTALLPRLTAAHTELVAAYQDTPASRLAPLVRALGRADFRHDSWVRAIHFGFETLIHDALARGDEAEAERLRGLRSRVLPHGLQQVRFSYREEAGQAELLSSQLDAQTRQALATLPAAGRTVLELVEDFMEAARELGELEDRRVAVRKGASSTLWPARQQWVAVFRLVEALLEMNREANPAIDDILARTAAIDEAANRRAQASNDQADIPDGEPEGDEPDGDEPDMVDEEGDELPDAAPGDADEAA